MISSGDDAIISNRLVYSCYRGGNVGYEAIKAALNRWMHFGTSFCCTGAVVLMLTVGVGRAQSRSSLSLATFGSINLNDSHARIVLAKVQQVGLPPIKTGQQRQFPLTISYQGIVIRELQQRIEANTTIEIMGHYGMQGSNPRDIPWLKVGDEFIMSVKTTEQVNHYEYDDSTLLPIGIECPSLIAPGETDRVEAALARLGQLIKNGGLLKHEEALALYHQDDYYLWSLGVAALALEGSQENAAILIQNYEQDSVRQVCWLERCFDYFPAAARPTIEQRYNLLLSRMCRLAGTDGR